SGWLAVVRRAGQSLARPMITGILQSRTNLKCTTSTPPCCTCLASITNVQHSDSAAETCDLRTCMGREFTRSLPSDSEADHAPQKESDRSFSPAGILVHLNVMRCSASRDDIDASVAVEIAGDEIFDGNATLIDHDLFPLRRRCIRHAVDEHAWA